VDPTGDSFNFDIIHLVHILPDENTLHKNDVDPTGDSLNFWYNTPGTYFT
jgi:hypothetical protein